MKKDRLIFTYIGNTLDMDEEKKAIVNYLIEKKIIVKNQIVDIEYFKGIVYVNDKQHFVQ